MRTRQRRDAGWFAQVLEFGRARISAQGLEAEVTVEDVGGDDADRRAGVDDAYRMKYGHHGRLTIDRVVTDDAAASTLLLAPEAVRE